MVDVVSRAGTLRPLVKVTEGMRPGAASIPHGWADANVNVLIDGHVLDPLTGMPALSGTPIEIRPASSTGDDVFELRPVPREPKALPN